jgi:hypothetical protein
LWLVEGFNACARVIRGLAVDLLARDYPEKVALKGRE